MNGYFHNFMNIHWNLVSTDSKKNHSHKIAFIHEANERFNFISYLLNYKFQGFFGIQYGDEPA